MWTFGRPRAATRDSSGFDETEAGSRVSARILGRAIAFDLGAPGAHMAENALGALLAAAMRSAPISTPQRRRSRDSRRRRAGASAFSLPTPDGPVTLIDESYNANPASMRAALKLLGAAEPGPNGRRIAVIGDMLELGADGAAMHAALAADLAANHVDLLFGAGPLTRALYDAAPEAMRAAWAERSSALADEVAKALRAGDVAMVKGSNGSRMGPLVAALREHFARPGAGRLRRHADLALRLVRASGRLPPLPLADLPHPRRGGHGAVSGAVLRARRSFRGCG